MWIYDIYIYMYTSVCLCASAHREERWNWSKVATMVSGYYPTVLSQIAITNTITITITTSIARYARVDTIPCRHSKSGHYPHLKLKRWHQHVQHARQRVHDQSQRQRVLVNLLVERNSDPAELDASVKEWTLSPFKAQALALSKSGNYRILRAWARSKSGNELERESGHYPRVETS